MRLMSRWRWGAKQATVFAAELRWAFGADTSGSAACVEMLVQHQLTCFLQSQLLLILQRI